MESLCHIMMSLSPLHSCQVSLLVDSQINNEMVRYYHCFFLRNNLIKTFHKQLEYILVVREFPRMRAWDYKTDIFSQTCFVLTERCLLSGECLEILRF